MQTYSKIWMHIIWATHKRKRIISKEIKKELIQHYQEYSKEHDIYLDTINGDMDHMHLLLKLKPTQLPSEIVNKLKGESSNWINKQDFKIGKFAWQNGYSIFSVSESQVNKVRNYIKGQEKHHSRTSFNDELSDFLPKYNLVENE